MLCLDSAAAEAVVVAVVSMRFLDLEGEGLCLALGLARTAHLCRRLRMARVCVAGSKVMIGRISGAGGGIGRGSVGGDGYEGGGGRSGGEVPVEDRTFGAAGDEDRVYGVPC